MHLPVFLLSLILLAASGMAQGEDGMRTLTGELFYLQRIALTPDSVAVVEFRDEQGRVRADSRFPTEGRQVPLPFALRVPVDTSGQLRGAIWSHGRPAWLSDPLAVAAGTEPRDVGEMRLHQFKPIGFGSRMLCGETEIEIGFIDDHARLRVDGETIDLHPAVAASGARFEAKGDPGTFFWSKGNTALVGLQGELLPECVPAVPAEPEPFSASGNEPGWTLQLNGGQIRLSLDYGTREIETALPPPQQDDGATRYVLPDADITVTVREQLCRDDMTGMPHPASVVVETDERRLQGCGGDPRDLIEGAEWTVKTIGGEAVPDDVTVTLQFLENDRVAGSSGCNRFMGGYELTGEGIAFGTLAGTMMACPEPQMEAEQQFLELLQQVARFEIDAGGIDAGGRLALETNTGQQITAER